MTNGEAATTRQPAVGEHQRSIALVDDDRNILTTLSIALQAEGYATRVYSDGETALKALVDNPPDLAVFDIKMPRMDGMELLRRLRERSNLPVIFLTSKDEEQDEAAGLAMGADDYISKPFSQRLLLARIGAILRRAGAPGTAENESGEAVADGPVLVRGRLAMDPSRHRVTWEDRPVSLTVTEFPHPGGAGAAARRDQEPQPADGLGLSRRRLRRRPHGRQPHQAPAPQVPCGRPRVRCDRHALRRRVQLLRWLTKRAAACGG